MSKAKQVPTLQQRVDIAGANGDCIVQKIGEAQIAREVYQASLADILVDWDKVPTFDPMKLSAENLAKKDSAHVAINNLRLRLNAAEMKRGVSEKHASGEWNLNRKQYRARLEGTGTESKIGEGSADRAKKRNDDQLVRDALAAWIRVINRNSVNPKSGGLTEAQHLGKDKARELMEIFADTVEKSPTSK